MKGISPKQFLAGGDALHAYKGGDMECNISEYTEQEIIIRPVAEIRKGKEDDYGFAKLEDKDIKGEGSTDWMPIAADYASTESGFWGLPEIGTMAVAVYSPEYKQGIIIGFLYDEKHKPPVEEGKNAANRTILQTKKHRFEITDEDGTEEISLTTAKGKMKVVLDGKGGIKIINVMKEGKINLNAEDSIEIESEEKGVQLKDKTKGELKIESEKSLKITPDKDIMIKASGKLEVKCSKIKLSGSKGITAKGKQVAKQDDKVVGLDTHIIMIPSINGEVPTPIPHPFTGQLKEKLEDCVKIGYKKVAVKGSVAKHGTGHIPQGPRFQSQPKNKGEITGGTEPSVKVKGKEIAVLGSSVSTCSDVGERENSKVIAAGTSTAATEKMLKKLEEEASAAAAASAAEQKQEEKEKAEKRKQDSDKQKAVIADVENGDEKLSSNMKKGNYGEMKMDQHFENDGYKRISQDRVTSLDEPTHQGIDGVYYKEGGDPEYIIAEAKYGKSSLGMTDDGKQMSEGWIKGSNRLKNAVGKEKANEILQSGYHAKLIRIKPDGTIKERTLFIKGAN